MLDAAFKALSPQLAERYDALLDRLLARSPELAGFHETYRDYALLDSRLPRPVLAYFGYHATGEKVTFADLDEVGDGLFLAQMVRDVLAIHDDIVDEDLEKFGAPPLPVALSDSPSAGLTKRGKDFALFYGDYLIGAMLQLLTESYGDTVVARVGRLVAETLCTVQRGQLGELLLEERPLAQISLDEVLLIGERKAASYCYAFPFALGAHVGGHGPEIIEPVSRLLLRIGTASQVVDDLTGAFPGVIDDDKDTLGEIVNLRRTVPLILLARQDVSGPVRRLIESVPPLSESDALRLREELWNSTVPRDALELCESLVAEILPRLDLLPTGAAATAYLRDLVRYRLVNSVSRFRTHLNERNGR